jgi:hypothetical protein
MGNYFNSRESNDPQPRFVQSDNDSVNDDEVFNENDDQTRIVI